METLHELLAEKRRELAADWIAAVGRTSATPMATAELRDRMPSFIDELVATLHPAALPLPENSSNAREHGVQRLRLGFNIAQVVREYGLLMQCILGLASRNQVLAGTDELIILNNAINAGIAEACSEYVWQRDLELRRRSDEHIGFIAHELRNPLSSARMSLDILKKRQQLSGRAAEALERSLLRLNELVDNALTAAWLKMGAEMRKRRIELGPLLHELLDESSVEAEWRQISMRVELPQPIEMDADERLLRSAVGNALRNAVKFSREGGQVEVRAVTDKERVLIEVTDQCGGLPPGKAHELLHPFVQRGRDQSGFGLGLAIARDAAQAHGGTIAIEDRPGFGCVVRFDLPVGHS